MSKIRIVYSYLIIHQQYSIWEDEGQDALESANILMLGCSATGLEILKNLILPGQDNAII